MDLVEKITQLIEPVLQDRGFELVRVSYQGNDNNNTLQVMAEHKDGQNMTADDCESLSRALSAILDVEDIIAGRYLLEVTSPGIDRPLVKLQDYDRFKGREAKIETLLPIDGRKRFKGLLKGVQGNQVLIDFEGNEIAIDFSAISKAKLVLTDELVAQLLKANK